MEEKRGYTNHNIHFAIKQMADELGPHLVMLSECPDGRCSDLILYDKIKAKLKALQPQVTNHDTFSAMHTAMSLLSRCKDLVALSAPNKELVWQLQEVMALLFKIQNLPI
jgi:hypothetical protein